MALIVTPAVRPVTPNAQSSSARAGLAFYLERRDREALSALEDARHGSELPLLVRLALADLYFVTGHPAKTRYELEALAAEASPPADVPIWMAWLDFTGGRAVRARRALMQLSASEDVSLASRAGFSLGWQLLLTGHTQEAANVLAAVEARNEEASTVGEAARLLHGEALMWSRRCGDAESLLQTISAAALRQDAARDRAWCHYTMGDEKLARDELEEVAHAGDPGAQPRFQVSWPVLMRQGPGALRPHWIAAYRNRPRAQDPIAFAIASADRDAAADARALLAVLDREEPVGSEAPGGRDIRRIRRRAEHDRTSARAALASDHARLEARKDEAERPLDNPGALLFRFAIAVAFLCGLALAVHRWRRCTPGRARVP